MVIGAPAAHRKFDRMGLAKHDHPGGEEFARQRRGRRRAVLAPYLRAASRYSPFKADQILERDRRSVQRADLMSRADRFVGSFRGQLRIIRVDVDIGVQLLILCRDPSEKRLGDLDRR
jgi:hypothetical protein